MDRWLAKVISLCVIFFLSTLACLLPLRLHGLFTRWGARGARAINLLTCFSGGVFFGLYLLHMGPESSDMVRESILIPHHINYPVAEVLIGAAFFAMLGLELGIKSLQVSRKHVHEKSETKEGDSTPYETLGDSQEEASSSSMAAAVVLLLALSLHHVFEGMGVGLKDNTSDVWKLTVAIISHEVIIAFVLGLQLVHAFNARTKWVVLAGVLCQIMTPVGIIVGIVLMDLLPGEDAANTREAAGGSLGLTGAVLHSISAGVFLYVTFCELLLEHYSQAPSAGKAVAVMLGFVVIGLLMLVHEGDHHNSTALECVPPHEHTEQ